MCQGISGGGAKIWEVNTGSCDFDSAEKYIGKYNLRIKRRRKMWAWVETERSGPHRHLPYPNVLRFRLQSILWGPQKSIQNQSKFKSY